MEIDRLDKFAKVLNNSAATFRQVAEGGDTSNLISSLMGHFEDLQTVGSMEEIKASISRSDEKQNVREAIQEFLQSTKEVQEKASAGSAGAMVNAIFASPQFQQLKDNLEQVKESLERGKKVEGLEEEQGI